MLPNPAGVVLTYGGTDIQDIQGIFLELIEGGPGDPADVRGGDNTAPHRDGQVAFPRRIHRRIIDLAGFIMGVGTDVEDQISDYRSNRVLLGTIFDCTVHDTLQATLENGQVYTIQARPIPDSFQYGKLAPMLYSLSLALESLDPDWTFVSS